MASYHGYNVPGPHNDLACPERLLQIQAVNDAIAALDRAGQIPSQNRGHTPWLRLEVADLPRSEDLMSNPQIDTDTLFPNDLTARKYREVLLPAKTQLDRTIPRSQEGQRAHVKVLFKAFKCVPKICACKEGIKKPFLNQSHDNNLVECLCWDILTACIQRSQKLGNLVDSWEPHKFKYKTDNWTFAERFDHIVDTLAKSKTICKHLFDVKYLYKIVDDPVSNSTRVDANRKLNGVKARVMKRGKEAEEEDKRQPKRVKTEDDSTNQGTPAYSPSLVQPHQHQQSLVAANPVHRGVVTPYRSHSTMQPSSAPANMGQNQHFQRQHLLQGPFQNPGNIFDATPSRLVSSRPNMATAGMLGAAPAPMAPRPWGHAMNMQRAYVQQSRREMPPPALMMPPNYYSPTPAQGNRVSRAHQQLAYATGPSSTPSSGDTESLSPSNHGPSAVWLMEPATEHNTIASTQAFDNSTSTQEEDPSFADLDIGYQDQWDQSHQTLDTEDELEDTSFDLWDFNAYEDQGEEDQSADVEASSSSGDTERVKQSSTETASERGDTEDESEVQPW